MSVSMRPRSASSGSTNKTVSHSATCAVVGDGGVGKTCLLLSHMLGKFIKDYLPGPVDWHSEFDHVSKHPVILERDGIQVQLNIVDTVGLDEYQKLREKVCGGADVYLICFDVTRPMSLESVKSHWVDEVKGYSPNAPYILVGTKTDERKLIGEDGRLNKDVVQTNQGTEIARQLSAFSYVECSAKDLTGMKNVFEHAALAFLEKTYPPESYHRKSCVVS